MPEQQFYNPNQDFAQQIDDLRRRTAALELAAARAALGVAGDTVKGERIYDTTTDRDNTITSPVDGDFVYIDSADINEGPYWYDGSNWRRAWNLPWGWLAETHSTPGLTGITTITDVLTLNWTSVSGRNYIIMAQIRFTMTGAGGTITSAITDSSNTNLEASVGVTITTSGNTATLWPQMYPRNPGAGSRADKLRIASTAAISTTGEASIWVLDVGPNGTPS